MRLDLVVGSNGAGKTTFVTKILAPTLPAGTVFVNADEIAKERWPNEPESKSYEAAAIAAATRETLISARRPFVAETVFSHPSKLELIDRAHRGGFRVALHVLLIPEDLAVQRVKHRVAAGGHTVPEEKIRERYRRLWAHVATAIGTCDSANVYDNSMYDGPVLVLQAIGGVVVGQPRLPLWAPAELRDRAAE